MGRRTDLVYETLVHERPTRLRFRGSNSSATATDTLTLVAEGAGTRMTYHAEFDFGRVGNLVAPLLIRRKLEKVADEVMEQLQQTLARA
jgi:carbon monoxide dehydrogenase subunit G